jgi:hypothetical protein
MDVQKIKFMVMCVASFVVCIPGAMATQWEDLEIRFSRWVTEHGVELPDEVSRVHGELRRLQEMEARNPWDNFPLKLAEEYPDIAEAWIRPVRLAFLKEGFMGTRAEWQAKHRGILLSHLGNLRDLFRKNTEELDALITLASAADDLEEAPEEPPAPQSFTAEQPFVLEKLPKDVYADPYVDQASILEEEMRRTNEVIARFLREKFSFMDEQVERYRTTFGRIYDEFVGNL